MTIKKILLGCFSALFALSLVACAPHSQGTRSAKDDNWREYVSKKRITVGFDDTFVPMGFKDKSGKIKGFDIDLATAVFKQYGIKVKWQSINWDTKETELKNKNIDLIWNGYSITQARKKMVRFSSSYMDSGQVLITKKSSHITRFSDMVGKTVGIQSGSSGYEAFIKHPEILKDKVAHKEATQYENFNQAFIDLKAERVDALLVDPIYANYYLKQEGNLQDFVFIDSPYQSEKFAVGARKSDITLVKKINRAFAKLYKEGIFQKLSEKWFGKDIASQEIKSLS